MVGKQLTRRMGIAQSKKVCFFYLLKLHCQNFGNNFCHNIFRLPEKSCSSNAIVDNINIKLTLLDDINALDYIFILIDLTTLWYNFFEISIFYGSVQNHSWFLLISDWFFNNNAGIFNVFSILLFKIGLAEFLLQYKSF